MATATKPPAPSKTELVASDPYPTLRRFQFNLDSLPYVANGYPIPIVTQDVPLYAVKIYFTTLHLPKVFLGFGSDRPEMTFPITHNGQVLRFSAQHPPRAGLWLWLSSPRQPVRPSLNNFGYAAHVIFELAYDEASADLLEDGLSVDPWAMCPAFQQGIFAPAVAGAYPNLYIALYGSSNNNLNERRTIRLEKVTVSSSISGSAIIQQGGVNSNVLPGGGIQPAAYAIRFGNLGPIPDWNLYADSNTVAQQLGGTNKAFLFTNNLEPFDVTAQQVVTVPRDDELIAVTPGDGAAVPVLALGVVGVLGASARLALRWRERVERNEASTP
jgi:hypothetical protein